MFLIEIDRRRHQPDEQCSECDSPGSSVFHGDGLEVFGSGVVESFGGRSLGRAQDQLEPGPTLSMGLRRCFNRPRPCGLNKSRLHAD